jgi:hypothetical protein
LDSFDLDIELQLVYSPEFPVEHLRNQHLRIAWNDSLIVDAVIKLVATSEPGISPTVKTGVEVVLEASSPAGRYEFVTEKRALLSSRQSIILTYR